VNSKVQVVPEFNIQHPWERRKTRTPSRCMEKRLWDKK